MIGLAVFLGSPSLSTAQNFYQGMEAYKQADYATARREWEPLAVRGDAIAQYKPRDATTNPSLITAAAQMPEYQDVVDAALTQSRKEVGDNNKKVVARAVDAGLLARRLPRGVLRDVGAIR